MDIKIVLSLLIILKSQHYLQTVQLTTLHFLITDNLLAFSVISSTCILIYRIKKIRMYVLFFTYHDDTSSLWDT